MPEATTQATHDCETARPQPVVELSKLPLFPPTALRLLNISTESATAPEDFENVFKSDAGLAAELLLVVNSASFGGRSRIDSIRHAIVFLGLERVRALANTVAFCFYVRKAPRVDYVRRIWRHSIAAAIACEQIGAVRGRTTGYTPGLLHDLGRLVFVKLGGSDYIKVISSGLSTLESIEEVEKNLFGMNHCEAGSKAAEHWGFPPNLVKCIAEHHHTSPTHAHREVEDVRLACRLASSLGYPEVLTNGCGAPLESAERLVPDVDPVSLHAQIVSRLGEMDA